MIPLLFCVGVATAGNPTVPQDLPMSETAPGLNPSEIVGPPEGSPVSESELDTRTHATASKLRCPTCQGMSVAESPAEGARAMKLEVKKMVAVGYSERQVLDFFEAAYGEFILLEPHKKGLNLTLWLAPAGLLLGGPALTFSRFRRQSATPAPAPPAPPPGADHDAYVNQVQSEIDS